ncbi:zinc finger protein 91-like isoform X2 [Neocloeon triangulifer]|uniref:zinc finger protein 91-like isoform X2 n=1 Tax=Neocloeon triangulifer TaxID=2078957 RepID=UPI00286ED146|nr:zinc finger protein 91-like isoform X2 [Neocloeon triangulifer]
MNSDQDASVNNKRAVSETELDSCQSTRKKKKACDVPVDGNFPSGSSTIEDNDCESSSSPTVSLPESGKSKPLSETQTDLLEDPAQSNDRFATIRFKFREVSRIEVLEGSWMLTSAANRADKLFILSTEKDLQSHIINIHNLGAYMKSYFQCEICKATTTFLLDMYNHCMGYHNLRKFVPVMMDKVVQYSCWQCKCCFATRELLICHKITHHFLKYKCNFCNTSKLAPKDILAHARQHFSDAFYLLLSETCNYASTDLSKIEYHELTHQKGSMTRMFSCHSCNYYASTKDMLQTHLQNQSHELNCVEFKCQECSLTTADSNVYIDHMKIEEIIKKTPFNCIVCCKRFMKHITLCEHISNDHQNKLREDKSYRGRKPPQPMKTTEQNLHEEFNRPIFGNNHFVRIQIHAPSTNSTTESELEDRDPLGDISSEVQPALPHKTADCATSQAQVPNPTAAQISPASKLYKSFLKLSKKEAKILMILDQTTKTCKICQTDISVEDVPVHFDLHCTPCCDACTIGKACLKHKKPHFRHPENYYDKLTQHKFVKNIDEQTLFCTKCKVTKHAHVFKLMELFYCCPECQSFFSGKEEAITHLAEHLANKVCRVCLDFSSASDRIMSIHLRSHMSLSVYICQSCKFHANNEAELIRHSRACKQRAITMVETLTNEDSPSFGGIDEKFSSMFLQVEKCFKCGEEFADKTRHESHMALKHPMIQCPLCFALVDSFETHFSTDHLWVVDKLTESYIWNIDDVASLTKQLEIDLQMARTMLRYSMMTDEKYKELLVSDCGKCRVCSLRLKCALDIEAHFRIHFTPCCSTCQLLKGKKCSLHMKPLFLHPDQYMVVFSLHHLQTCSEDGEKRFFKCKNCHISFKNHREKRIIASCSKDRYRCDECDYDRLLIEDLDEHILEHMSKMECYACNFTSNSKEVMNNHIGNQHPVTYKCPNCFLFIGNESLYIKHRKECIMSFQNTKKVVPHIFNINKYGCCIPCKVIYDSDLMKRCHLIRHPLFFCPLCKNHKNLDFKAHLVKKHSSLITRDKAETIQMKTPTKQNEAVSTLINRVADIISSAKTNRSLCFENSSRKVSLLLPLHARIQP